MATTWVDGTTPLNATNMNDIESRLAALEANSLLSGGTQITSGTDANELTTPGRYYTTAGMSGTITNFPYTSASFVFIVLQGIARTRIIQWCFPSSSNYLY